MQYSKKTPKKIYYCGNLQLNIVKNDVTLLL